MNMRLYSLNAQFFSAASDRPAQLVQSPLTLPVLGLSLSGNSKMNASGRQHGNRVLQNGQGASNCCRNISQCDTASSTAGDGMGSPRRINWTRKTSFGFPVHLVAPGFPG